MKLNLQLSSFFLSWQNDNSTVSFQYHALYRTRYPVLAYVFVDILQVTPGLKVSSVGVKVVMCHSLLDAHTEAQTLVGEGVDGVHKLCIIRRKSVCGGHAFKQRPCWIQTWTQKYLVLQYTNTQKNIQT